MQEKPHEKADLTVVVPEKKRYRRFMPAVLPKVDKTLDSRYTYEVPGRAGVLLGYK